ncbi:MAG: helix-turn-helix domain-containing protein [Verrucomicrobiaceae bacterium]
MRGLQELFEHLPMVVFWVKDREGRFVRCNRRFEDFHGLGRGEWKGMTDFDLHAPEMAARYREEDERVIEAGEALPNEVWMVPDRKGVLHWWVSTKAPVMSPEGEICGVAGAMYEIADAAGMMSPYDRLEGALTLLHQEYGRTLSGEELAKASFLSVSQFNRVFREVMGQSVKEYLNSLRVEMAKGLLLQTDKTLAEIAGEVGFYDGSEFGKRFKKKEGVTPREYRGRLRIGN